MKKIDSPIIEYIEWTFYIPIGNLLITIIAQCCKWTAFGVIVLFLGYGYSMYILYLYMNMWGSMKSQNVRLANVRLGLPLRAWA